MQLTDGSDEQAGPLVQMSITRGLVGRVIGRGGMTVQRIRAQTQARPTTVVVVAVTTIIIAVAVTTTTTTII